MSRLVEEVFVTEGVPEYTFVPPPNFNDILIDMRRPGKPVIVEGQSGTGKTTAIKKIVERVDRSFTYLSSREASDVEIMSRLAQGGSAGTFVIDDFHRLSTELQANLADRAKVAAEQPPDAPSELKLILVGINELGSNLIQLVPDIAKRTGIHRIEPGTSDDIRFLIESGCNELNVVIRESGEIFGESHGDYWLTQQLCQTICTMNGVTEECDEKRVLDFDIEELRRKVIAKLKASYYPSVKTFCRGRRFRPTNDPYFKLLRAVGASMASTVDLNELANSSPEVRGSVNNVKEHRLSVLIQSKPECARYFYYNKDTKYFAIEDPAMSYFLRHMDWETLRQDCGFRESERDFEFDVALSFAGENRQLARCIASNLEYLDMQVFFDENYESNYLGQTWSNQFERIFGRDSRLVVCLLDRYHKEKIWPTFERECFEPRVAEGEVIPVFLDDTKFPGIPADLVGVRFEWRPEEDGWEDRVVDDVVLKIAERLDGV